MKADNDNETFQPIGLAARRLLVKLSEEQDKQDDKERDAEREAEEQRARHASYLEQRRRDFERFEAMVRGTIAPRRHRDRRA